MNKPYSRIGWLEAHVHLRRLICVSIHAHISGLTRTYIDAHIIQLPTVICASISIARTDSGAPYAPPSSLRTGTTDMRPRRRRRAFHLSPESPLGRDPVPTAPGSRAPGGRPLQTRYRAGALLATASRPHPPPCEWPNKREHNSFTNRALG